MTIVADQSDSVRTASPAREAWRDQLRRAVRDADELCRLLQLPADFAVAARRAAATFPVFAPHSFIARMAPGDPADPLLRQVLPVDAELNDAGQSDPVGDAAASSMPGLIEKYAGRALLVLTGACAVHCRYCFRRHFPYHESPRSLAQWEPALERLARQTDIEEVLLSGGDPLTLVDELLGEFIERLARIPHLRRLRIHTRLPIMIPDRVTEALLRHLRRTRLVSWMVIHANHAAELNEPVAEAVGRLVDGGVPLLNQAVLLRGVNDDVTTLAQLSRRLCDLRITPYYLHQLDPVQGATHFGVPVARGRQLVTALREQLPGYAVPRYVQEIPGESGKRLLA